MIQIDIEMPETCEVCPCLDNVYGECQIDFDITVGFDVCEGRPSKCPMKQIESEGQTDAT